MKSILLVGPHISCNGGITAVFKNYLSYERNIICKFYLHSVRKDSSKINKLLYIFPSLISFIFKLLTKGIDIIHIHPSENFGFYRYIPFIYLSKLIQKPILLHMHGCKFDKFYNSANKLQKLIIRNTFNCSNGIICLSKSWENIYSTISETKTYVVNNTVPQPSSNPYNIKSKSITFMGFVGDRKGIFDLLKAIVNLDVLIDYQLEICGSGEEKKLYNKIKEFNLEEHITFHGWIGEKEKDKILRRTNIFILPSYNEGLPMVLLEAMSYGIPVISTPVGGIPELVEKENGFLIEPGDVNSLHERIQLLFKNLEIRRIMSNSNYNKIKQNFSMEYTFNKLELIYNEILS